MALQGSIAFLHLLLLSFTETNVVANPLIYNTTLSAVGYFGPNHLIDIVIYNANASWFDALHECNSTGYSIAKTSPSGTRFLHLRDYLFRNHPEFIGVPLWTGFVKPNLDGGWYEQDKCDKTVSEIMSSTFLNNTAGERQCLLMNMSVNAVEMDYSWYATSCYEQHPFICELNLGERPLVAYEGMQLQHVDTDTSVTKYSNMVLEECVDELNNAGKVFIVEYNSSSETCTLYKRSLFDLPFEVNLTVIGEDNTTISYLKSEENRVTVLSLSDAVYTNIYQSTDLPCYGYSESTETTIAPTPTTALLLMTTTATLDVSSSLDQTTATLDVFSSFDQTTAVLDISSSLDQTTATLDVSSLFDQSTAALDVSSLFDQTTATFDVSSSLMATTATLDVSSSLDQTTGTFDVSSSLDQWIVWTKEENIVDETTLSSYRNKRVSAYDGRSSSTAIGSFGAIFIATAIILVVLSDLPIIVRDLRHNVHQWKPHTTEETLKKDILFFKVKNTCIRRHSV